MTLGYLALIVLTGGSGLSVACRLLASRRWLRATATVTALDRGYRNGDTDVDSTMRPTVRFFLPDGSPIFAADVFSLGPLNVGDRVEIRYHPTQPNRVLPQSVRKRFKMEIMVALFGLFIGSFDLAGLITPG